MADVVIIQGKAVDRQLAEQLWDLQRELKVLRAENHRLQQQLRDAYARIPSVTAWDEHAAALRVAMNESKALRERLRRAVVPLKRKRPHGWSRAATTSTELS